LLLNSIRPTRCPIKGATRILFHDDGHVQSEGRVERYFSNRVVEENGISSSPFVPESGSERIPRGLTRGKRAYDV
jgi:hypothetical protein